MNHHSVQTESALPAGLPDELTVAAEDVAATLRVVPDGRRRVFVVLDDDPTGTQSVAHLPVLTRWEVEDFAWAFLVGTPAVYVLTNTRCLDPREAAQRNREVVRHALAAASDSPGALHVSFISRSDSTLRGHFPLETDTIGETLLEAGQPVDGVVLVPAFPEAGRVTIGGTHYVRDSDEGRLVPAAETEFAADASFGYRNSYLPAYVEEKSGGRIPAASVIVLRLDVIRADGQVGTSREAIADVVGRARNGVPIVVDAVTEDDLRAVALGLDRAERRGASLLYRVGPPFVRARIGQDVPTVLAGARDVGRPDSSAAGGLVVVGSHVAVTTRQLDALTARHPRARIVELDVGELLGDTAARHLDDVVEKVVESLAEHDVVLHTSRSLVRTQDPVESLRIARTVSAAVVDVVRRTLALTPPRFVIAKGGITSSDVAAHGLQIRRAMVRGPMLPGIVSLWEPVDGPARGIPFVVFAGNVGDDGALVDVVRKLSSTWTSS